jgi:2-polyprenyl-6-methoxyphenol hydroxylase-like FAD-dependent oxidoreductase
MQGLSVLISGVGIAGPALAHELLRAGCVPTLVEVAPALRASGYVIDFWGQGFDVIESMGLVGDVLREGYTVRELRLVDRDGRKVGGFDVELLAGATRGRFTSLERGALGKVLYRAIEGRAEVMFGCSIRALDEQPDGVLVHFDHAPSRRFDLVVGADGLHSRVRQLVFGPRAQFERFLGYVAAAFELKGYRPRDPDVYVAHAAPGRQVARFSMRDDRTLVLLVAADTQASARERHAQIEFLRERFADVGWECPAMLEALPGCDELYFDRVSQICMPAWSRGRVALLGDAAFAPSLLAGQGSALAILAAHVLAGELARADDIATALANYQALLRPLLERKQRDAARFASWFAPRTQTRILVRRAITRAFNNVPFASRLSRWIPLRDDVTLPAYTALSDPAHAASRTETARMAR